MACKSCTSGCQTQDKDSKVKGCGSNGCATGGCNKMNSFNWLEEMDMPIESLFHIVEVRFKNGKKEFFRNTNQLDLTTGDAVVVEMPSGYHVGFVALQGELVRLQMLKKDIKDDENIKSIYRIANQKDLEKFNQSQERNLPTMFRTREIILDLGLDMKLSDVEYQADNTKATFYYSAEDRIDFRELIKLLATEFKIRVEMRQISLRQEAGRLGGIGSCGRELCCSTWLSEFKNVSTTAARYQNLSLNPNKLSGQCGRLKCCLNYELDTYIEALKDIPSVEEPLLTQKGKAILYKTDIFKKIMWFSYERETTWYPLTIQEVNTILEMNKQGIMPIALNILEEKQKEVAEEKVLNSDLEKLNQKFNNKKKKKKKKNKPKLHLNGKSAENTKQK